MAVVTTSPRRKRYRRFNCFDPVCEVYHPSDTVEVIVKRMIDYGQMLAKMGVQIDARFWRQREAH